MKGKVLLSQGLGKPSAIGGALPENGKFTRGKHIAISGRKRFSSAEIEAPGPMIRT
jgi:hypothetical protein